MKREDGFYWVKFQGDWITAEWWCDCWWVCGSEIGLKDTNLDSIGEQIKKPD